MKEKFVVVISLLAFSIAFLNVGIGIAQEKAVVTYAHPYGPPWRKAMKEKCRLAQKEHPSIKVKEMMIPWEGMFQKLATMIAAGNAPSLVHVWGTFRAPQLAQMGLLQSLDKFTSKDPEWNPDDFYPGYLEAMTWKGKLWGLCSGSQAQTLAWNKELFAESGLDPETPPKSLEEIVEFHKKIYKIRDGKIITYGFIPNNLWGGFMAWAYYWGGKFYDKETGKITASNPVNVKALQWQVDFFKKYGGAETVTSWQEGFAGGANDPFIKGKLGMMTANHYHYYFWYKYGPKDFLKKSVGYAPIPEFPGPDTLPKGQVISSNAEVMLKGCKYPEAAYTILKEILFGEPFIVSSMDKRAYQSVKKSINRRFYEAGRLPDFWPDDLWKLELAMQKKKRPWPPMPVVGKLQDELKAQVELAYRGKKSAKEALEYVDRVVQRELERVLRRR